MRLLLALLLSASFVEVTVSPDEGRCEADGALACVALAEGEALARIGAPEGARYEILAADGTTIASGAVPPDGMVPLVPGAARLVVRAA